MITRTKLLAAALAIAVLGGPVGCSKPEQTERWATTENTNVKIDWDKVDDAYKAAEGPADLERRINELYEGSEIISISVHDTDDKIQVVTGFFDKNTDGKVDEAEKIFTIQRTITGEGQGQYQTQGYGYYGGYHSPMMSIVSGMVMGSMMASIMSPRYVPIHTQPYVTSAGRHAELRGQRSTYRAANPARFSRPSRTGKSYGGSPGKSSAPARSRGGSRFGARAGRPGRGVATFLAA